jgi:lipid II:glycine glycyltransferase (peptidoglycan interpeptide bridge formation enzyme)
MKSASVGQLANWDKFVLANPDGGHIYQSKAWGEFKADYHWIPRYYIYEINGRKLAVLYLVRKFSYFGELWWAPKGPGVANQTELLEYVSTIKLPPEAFMLRINPVLTVDSVDHDALTLAGLVKAKRDVQPDKSTVLVDLSRSEADIMSSFKQKTRYNVRLAAKKGVDVLAVESTVENLGLMYDMMHETSSRAKYYMREKAYYIDYWRRLTDAGQGQLMFAVYDNEVLAGLFAIYFGDKAWYKDGGSLKKHSNVMAPYLLQWEAMRWLKKKGVKTYDLVGVPAAKDISPDSKLYSLYQFKSGFNNEITEYINSYDLPLSGAFRDWNLLGERLVSKYYMMAKQELIY